MEHKPHHSPTSIEIQWHWLQSKCACKPLWVSALSHLLRCWRESRHNNSKLSCIICASRDKKREMWITRNRLEPSKNGWSIQQKKTQNKIYTIFLYILREAAVQLHLLTCSMAESAEQSIICLSVMIRYAIFCTPDNMVLTCNNNQTYNECMLFQNSLCMIKSMAVWVLELPANYFFQENFKINVWFLNCY